MEINYLDKARKFYKQKNYKGAIKYFENFAKNGKLDARIMEEIGITYFKINKIKKSKEYLEKTILIDPTRFLSHCFLSYIYEKLGDFESSNSEAIEAHKHCSSNSEVDYCYSLMLIRNNQFGEAEEILNKLTKIKDFGIKVIFAKLILEAKNKNRGKLNKNIILFINLKPPINYFCKSLLIYRTSYSIYFSVILIILIALALLLHNWILLSPLFVIVFLEVYSILDDIRLHNTYIVGKSLFRVMFFLIGTGTFLYFSINK